MRRAFSALSLLFTAILTIPAHGQTAAPAFEGCADIAYVVNVDNHTTELQLNIQEVDGGKGFVGFRFIDGVKDSSMSINGTAFTIKTPPFELSSIVAAMHSRDSVYVAVNFYSGSPPTLSSFVVKTYNHNKCENANPTFR